MNPNVKKTILIDRGKDSTPLQLGSVASAPMIMTNEQKGAWSDATYQQLTDKVRLKNNRVIRSMTNAQQAEFFVRQLSYFYPNLLMKKYADLKFRQFCPIVRGEAWDLLNITQMYDVVGEVSAVDQAAGNLGAVGVSGEEQIDKIKDLQVFVEWTFSEFQADLTWGKIKPAKFFAMQRVFEQALNTIFYFGNSVRKQNGVLVDPTIENYAAAGTGSGGSSLWVNKNPSQILADIRDALTNLNSLSNGRFNARKVVISLNQFNYVFGRPRSDYVDTSIFKYILSNFPMLESIEGDAVLNNQGPSNTGLMILFDNESSDNYYMNIPLEMLPLPLFQKGTLMQFPFMTRSTGLIVPYSPSINVVTNL